MQFVLALHSHLPYVLHHGRWPHGSVWLSEAALDTYLPLIEALLEFERQQVRTPVTLGVTPVLANQLASGEFVSDFEAYMKRRLEAAADAPASLTASGDQHLVPLAQFWHKRLTRLLDLFHSIDRDIVGALRGLEQRGRIELFSSAATHGFLPLLGRDESIRLQLRLGAAEHRRLFGRDPAGCWLPECAFRPAGPWAPAGARPAQFRIGIDDHLRDAGFRYFFVDAPAVQAGRALGYPDYHVALEVAAGGHSPYMAYRVATGSDDRDLLALVRDPRSSSQVWSRAQGYPGDEWYLEFHKIRWPDGLRLWRVTGSHTDLGGKQPYEPGVAQSRVHAHASHFASTLHDTAASQQQDAVVVAPFDAELFGHWWFEGVDFVSTLYRVLKGNGIKPMTAGEYIATHPPRGSVALAEGSWGKDGDFSMWLNDRTAWTWARLWPLEDAFWSVARAALQGGPDRRAVLEAATRSLLLAQASDWQFIMSTGAATDYADQRFREHVAEAEDLVAALQPGAALDERVMARVAELRTRNAVFPHVLETVEQVLA